MKHSYLKDKLLIIIILLLIIPILSFILFTTPSNPSNDSPKAIINGKVINLELATTPLERQKGLMFRTNLEEDSGMLFIFPDEQIRYFWMKNTLIPLDMIFIDSDNKIIDIQTAEPCMEDPCKNYISKFPAKYVLELNMGYTERNDIYIGDKINIRI